MPIQPLPQFEADLAAHLKEKEDRQAYERLNAPSSIVVRFGYLRMVGEFPYRGEAKPGCGSKLVVRTHRGTEIGEMLTSTCPNSGCSKSVSRKEMLEYIENSGGRQYPFYERGRVLRIATPDDLNEQQRMVQRANELRMIVRKEIERAGLAMQVIEVEQLLGGERVVVYFGAEDRVDFRDLVQDLQRQVGTKVELRQIGARDEARITADYERCGQYCCCKNFLKVLKPVSMKSAKIQKATLDPLKISGRCGRLMCCLRYEDETYEQLRKNLPHRKSRVGTPDGDGFVMSTQILTQLALIKLDDGTESAFPIEDLTEPDSKTPPDPRAKQTEQRSKRGSKRGSDRDSDRGKQGGGRAKAEPREQAKKSEPKDSAGPAKKKRKRRRRRGGTGGGTGGEGAGVDATGSGSGAAGGSAGGTGEQRSSADKGDQGHRDGGSAEAGGSTGPKKKRRRRRRRRGGDGPGGAGQENDRSGGNGS